MINYLDVVMDVLSSFKMEKQKQNKKTTNKRNLQKNCVNFEQLNVKQNKRIKKKINNCKTA